MGGREDIRLLLPVLSNPRVAFTVVTCLDGIICISAIRHQNSKPKFGILKDSRDFNISN